MLIQPSQFFFLQLIDIYTDERLAQQQNIMHHWWRSSREGYSDQEGETWQPMVAQKDERYNRGQVQQRLRTYTSAAAHRRQPLQGQRQSSSAGYPKSTQPVPRRIMSHWPPLRSLFFHRLDALDGCLACRAPRPRILPCLRLRSLLWGGGRGRAIGSMECQQAASSTQATGVACTCCSMQQARHTQPCSPLLPLPRVPPGPLPCQAADCAAPAHKFRHPGLPTACRSNRPWHWLCEGTANPNESGAGRRWWAAAVTGSCVQAAAQLAVFPSGQGTSSSNLVSQRLRQRAPHRGRAASCLREHLAGLAVSRYRLV